MGIVDDLIKAVRQREFYVPRQYQTIGGMWTTDTWKCGDVVVRVMDEGYTTIVYAPGLRVVRGYDGTEYTRYEEGDEVLANYYLLAALKSSE